MIFFQKISNEDFDLCRVRQIKISTNFWKPNNATTFRSLFSEFSIIKNGMNVAKRKKFEIKLLVASWGIDRIIIDFL